MKSLYFSIFLFFIAYHHAFAQQDTKLQLEKKIDSLLIEVGKSKTEDSLKLSRYYQLSRNYIRLGKTGEVENYIGKTIQLAQKINQPRLVAQSYYWLGFYYHGINDYLRAEEAYINSIAKFYELRDKSEAAGIYLNLSALYVDIPDYVKALETNLKAVELFNEIRDEQSVAASYVNIASIYSDLKQHSTAIAYLEKAVKIFLKSKDTDYGIALCYANLGDIYFDISNAELKKIGLEEGAKYNKSLDYLSQALKYVEKIDNNASLLGSIYQTQGNVYKLTGNKDLAQEFYLKSISANRKLHGKGAVGISLLSLANFYIGNSEYEKAKPLLAEALSIGETLKVLKLQRDVNLALSNVAEKKGNYVNALKYYKEFIFFKEQIFNEEKEKEVTRKQLRLDFSIKERDYQTKQQLTDLALDKQVLLVRERQQQLLLNQQQLALSDKEKNIQRLSFLQKQAALEQEKVQKEHQLTQQKLISSLEKEQAKQDSLNQESKIKFTRNISIFFGVLATVLLAAAIYVYKVQRKTAKLNQLVSAQKEELESLSKVKDRIFSVVSHDMRTPVNSLISFINLLEMGNVSEEKLKRYAATLKNSLGYTSAMMENLLNWAYSQMQGFKPNLQSFELDKVTEELVASAKVEAAQKKIEITYTGIAGIMVMGDVNMVSLVIRNLLNNAIKFTEPDGKITLNLLKIEKSTCIEIVDTGIGMSEEQMTSFNHKTTQLGETTLGTNKEKGTGLGLTLCKTFAQIMNSELSVKSNNPKGTIFTLCLTDT